MTSSYVIVKGFSLQTSKRQLDAIRSVFVANGCHCTIRGLEKSEVYGLGIVFKFQNVSQAEKAVAKYNQSTLFGETITMEYYHTSLQESVNYNIPSPPECLRKSTVDKNFPPSKRRKVSIEHSKQLPDIDVNRNYIPASTTSLKEGNGKVDYTIYNERKPTSKSSPASEDIFLETKESQNKLSMVNNGRKNDVKTRRSQEKHSDNKQINKPIICIERSNKSNQINPRQVLLPDHEFSRMRTDPKQNFQNMGKMFANAVFQIQKGESMDHIKKDDINQYKHAMAILQKCCDPLYSDDDGWIEKGNTVAKYNSTSHKSKSSRKNYGKKTHMDNTKSHKCCDGWVERNSISTSGRVTSKCSNTIHQLSNGENTQKCTKKTMTFCSVVDKKIIDNSTIDKHQSSTYSHIRNIDKKVSNILNADHVYQTCNLRPKTSPMFKIDRGFLPCQLKENKHPEKLSIADKVLQHSLITLYQPADSSQMIPYKLLKLNLSKTSIKPTLSDAKIIQFIEDVMPGAKYDVCKSVVSGIRCKGNQHGKVDQGIEKHVTPSCTNKKIELQAFKNDCLAITTTSKLLIKKNPDLEERLVASCKDVLTDLSVAFKKSLSLKSLKKPNLV